MLGRVPNDLWAKFKQAALNSQLSFSAWARLALDFVATNGVETSGLAKAGKPKPKAA